MMSRATTKPEISTRTCHTDALADTSARTCHADAQADTSTRTCHAEAQADESARTCHTDTQADESARTCHAEAQADESARTCHADAQADTSTRTCHTDALADESARTCYAEAQADESARTCHADALADESALIGSADDLGLASAADEAPLTDAEAAALKARMWPLLCRRARYLTMSDSTSMPVETAEALLESVGYTLRLHLARKGLPTRALLTLDPDALFDDALKTLAAELEHARRLYRHVTERPPTFVNRAYRDTVRSIGGFFARYDMRAFAQAIPCDVDYPLCHPLPDALCGASYIGAYLARLAVENELVNRCDAPAVERCMQRYCPDPVGQLVNVYEAVATNALGAALTNGDIAGLRYASDDRRAVADRLRPLSHAERVALLYTAAERVCDRLRIVAPPARAYCEAFARDWLPRLEAELEG